MKYYNENVKTDPEAYAQKKKQFAGYMNERYKNDPECLEKHKQRQRDLYHIKKAQLKMLKNPLNNKKNDYFFVIFKSKQELFLSQLNIAEYIKLWQKQKDK